MNERDVSEKVSAWGAAVVGITAPGSIYAYPVANLLGDLPMIAMVCDRKLLMPVTRELLLDFPWLELEQQQWARVFECSGSVMIELPDQEEASALAGFRELQGYGAALENSAWDDYRLGNRLPDDAGISPRITFDYSPVFEELDDGTKGRTMAIALRVAQVVDAEPE